MPDYLEVLKGVISEVVEPAASSVDRDGVFPRAAIDALGKTGILGLTCAADVGGGGHGLREAAEVVGLLAQTCGSTAMVVLMHYSAVVAIEQHASRETREKVAAGSHLSTLAFSEAGSRSHFWAPLGSAQSAGGGTAILNAKKSWVTSAGQADSYVWSSRPLSSSRAMTLWLMPADASGLSDPPRFDGLGLRGNGSAPITATDVAISEQAMLGEDGGGIDIALSEVLPWFLVQNAAFCVGLMRAVTAETAAHLKTSRLEHLDQTLMQQPVTRADFARMHVATDQAAAFVSDTLAALESQRADAILRVLEVKAVAAEAAIAVTDLAMKLCGGSAFRKELGVERRFRDARAARVMAPTTDALLDFLVKALAGEPLLEG